MCGEVMCIMIFFIDICCYFLTNIIKWGTIETNGLGKGIYSF